MSYDLGIAVKVDGCGKFAEIATPEYRTGYIDSKCAKEKE